ncbi:MAG: iron-containing alcohol dehydrogenase [Planctomycetaceae bacterium]|nr:iron-containing alcohol dehydrogenase [Planctomycetaceae bacterium]
MPPAPPTHDEPTHDEPTHDEPTHDEPTHDETVDSHRLNGRLTAFDYQPRTRVVFGPGRIAELGDLARELGGRHVLLVTDHGLEGAGHPQRGIAALESAGVAVTLFDEVHQNPTTDDVDRGLAVARDAGIDLIVGLGGGSSMDCAKGINFLLTNGGRMHDYWGAGKARLPLLPMLAVPTTSGTGSEAQSYALIADAQTHMKMACGDPKAACRLALLDPELTLSMPASVTAATGIDALSHALESYVSTAGNPVSQLLGRQAWQLLVHGFPAVLNDPADSRARAKMLLGAHLAGAAIENSMLGATHALANPLSAHFDITHGVAIGAMLPHVIRYNQRSVGSHYADLAAEAGLVSRTGSVSANATTGDVLADHVTVLVARAGLPTRLRDCGVDAGLFTRLAAEAAQQWTARFNPRPVDEQSLRQLYEEAL